MWPCIRSLAMMGEYYVGVERLSTAVRTTLEGNRKPRFMPYRMTATDHPGVRATVGLGLAGTHFVLERQPGDRVDRFEQARL